MLRKTREKKREKDKEILDVLMRTYQFKNIFHDSAQSQLRKMLSVYLD